MHQKCSSSSSFSKTSAEPSVFGGTQACLCSLCVLLPTHWQHQKLSIAMPMSVCYRAHFFSQPNPILSDLPPWCLAALLSAVQIPSAFPARFLSFPSFLSACQ